MERSRIARYFAEGWTKKLLALLLVDLGLWVFTFVNGSVSGWRATFSEAVGLVAALLGVVVGALRESNIKPRETKKEKQQ